MSSRILLYLVYFFAGIGVGAWGLDRGLLANGGKLAQRWPLWLTESQAGELSAAQKTGNNMSHDMIGPD